MFDPESLSAALTWQEFEGLAENAFQSLGYSTSKNFRVKSPRTEIDLLAWQRDVVFGVDCKHWKRTVGYSTMNKIGEKQIARCKTYLQNSSCSKIVPVILTWHDENLHILNSGVPIVPINKISDFVLNWESSPLKICSVEKRKKRPRKARSLKKV